MCNLNVVESPFPSIERPSQTLPDFMSNEWMKPKSHLQNKVAIIDGYTNQSRTFQDYYYDMGSFAANFQHELQLSNASTISLFSPNHVDYVPVCLAVGIIGAKVVPINPTYTVRELVIILKSSKSDVLILHENLVEIGLEAVKECENIKHVVMMPSGMEGVESKVPEGVIDLNSLKDHSQPIYTMNEAVDIDASPVVLPYSSGTTGLPKGVCLSHSNIVSNLLQLEQIESMAFPSNHKLISPLPFFHIYGFTVSALYCAWQGQQILTNSGRFDLELFCQMVEKNKPQRAHLVPPILNALAFSPLAEKYDLSSINMILSAAAPLPKEVEDRVKQRLDCDIKQGWGMSELSPIATLCSEYDNKSGSVGQLIPNTYGKIMDSSGANQSLGPNQEGELCIKGPQVMLGYLDAPEKTAECLTSDGWLKTGDLAKYDGDGFFYITDRLKELIKVRGYQVAPAELEALLLTNPHIKDAAVIPVPDAQSGELPRAYVTMETDEASQKVTEEDVKAWVKERVMPAKRLEGGVVFIEQVPKSASGKILRRLLVEKAKAED